LAGDPSDPLPRTYIRNYTTNPGWTYDWFIGRQGTCEFGLIQFPPFFHDIYTDGIAQMAWMNPLAVREPSADKIIGVWQTEAWRYNWSAVGGPNDPNTCITYLRYDDDGLAIPVMTDLIYEKATFGFGVIAWHSHFSREKIDFDVLNQWQSQNCPARSDRDHKPTRKSLSVYDSIRLLAERR